MSLKSKRIALLLDHNYEDLEATYPRIRLMEEGATVDIIAVRHPETYKGKHGYPLKSTHKIDDVSPDDYDAVIIPGGMAPDYMRRSSAMVKFVEDMDRQEKVVAAICHGPWLLCTGRKDGNDMECMVKGRKATSFSAIKYDLVNAGVHWVDEEVVVDGNLVTSRTPDDLTPFCKAIISLLSK